MTRLLTNGETMPIKPAFFAFICLLLTGVGATAQPAPEELPLGTTRTEMEKSYGKSAALPITHSFGRAPVEDDPANTAYYPNLQPPRFYKFHEGKSVLVHYYDLSNRDDAYVARLLSIYARHQALEEIDSKTIGHDPKGLGTARAWKCPSQKWTALYRSYKATSPSLLIYTEESVLKGDVPLR